MLSKNRVMQWAELCRSGEEKVLDDPRPGKLHVVITSETIRTFEDLTVVRDFLLGNFLKTSENE